MTADGARGAAEPDFSLVLLDDEGRPFLVLSSEPAPPAGGAPVASPDDGRARMAPVPTPAAAVGANARSERVP